MSYHNWFEEHAQKHGHIVKKLLHKDFTQEDIIEYFDFDNMKIHEPDFCPLYAQNKKCHDLKELNCYLCACPNFRFDDSGFTKQKDVTQFSFCDIDSKDGKQAVYGNAIHQDCSGCTVPHHKDYITKNFHIEWKSVMNSCKNSS